jgi:N-acetylglucosaminyl-diphospho-decaprenol L-rhamnosyltransferase
MTETNDVNRQTKVCISIVSHGQKDLVKKLLASIDRHLLAGSIDLKIIITENTAEAWFPKSKKFQLSFHQNVRLKGFGANHNSIFEKIDCDYFIVMNPDVIFHGWFDLNEAINHLKLVKADISSPVILNALNEPEDYKRSDITPASLLRRHILRKKDDEFHWFSGICLFFNSGSFRSLSGFDTKYFMYVEDCDICMRARTLGMKLYSLDDFRITHLAQRASHRDFRRLRMHIVSLLKYWAS